MFSSTKYQSEKAKTLLPIIAVFVIVLLYMYKRSTPYVGSDMIMKYSTTGDSALTADTPVLRDFSFDRRIYSVILLTRDHYDEDTLRSVHVSLRSAADGHEISYTLADASEKFNEDDALYIYEYTPEDDTSGWSADKTLSVTCDTAGVSLVNDTHGDLWVRFTYSLLSPALKLIAYAALMLVLICCMVLFCAKNRYDAAKCFLFASLILGCVYLMTLTPFGITDADNHYVRSYTLARGQILVPADGYVDIPRDLIPFESYGASPSGILGHTQVIAEGETVRHNLVNMALYNPLSYIVQAVGILIVRIFTQNTYVMAFAGSIANLVVCSLLIFHAIRVTPIGKEILALVSLFPMAMQCRSGLSVDGITYAVALCTLAYFLKFRLRREPITRRELVIMYLLLIALSSCKVIYFVIGFPVLLIPEECFGDKRRARIHRAAGCALTLIWSLGWIIFASGYISNTRGGSNAGEKVSFILHNPHRYIYILDKTLWNDGMEYLFQMLGSNLGMLQINVSLIALAALIVVVVWMVVRERTSVGAGGVSGEHRTQDGGAAAVDGSSTAGCDRVLRVVLVCIAIVGVLLIATSLYVQWTSVDAMTYSIEGLQGRYFLPLLPLILIALLRVPAGGMRSAEGAATTAASNETAADTPDEKGHDIRAWFLVACTVNLCALIDILNNGSYLG